VKESANFDDFDTEDITFTYCTEFIIQRENDLDPEKLRDFLSSLGDSLVLVDDEEIIKVHVHTNDPGKALTKGVEYGAFETVKVENMRIQHENAAWMPEDEEAPAAPARVEPEEEFGFVAVAAGFAGCEMAGSAVCAGCRAVANATWYLRIAPENPGAAACGSAGIPQSVYLPKQIPHVLQQMDPVVVSSDGYTVH
jgi:dihydroxyacetone kinase-like predicted kinase